MNSKRVRAKKSLGQHFLKAPHVIARMCAAANIKKDAMVLEVGPGKGALTKALLARKARVVAVEKDARLIAPLAEMFTQECGEKRLTLVHGDILHFDPHAHGLTSGMYTLVANIPYYITGIFLKRFLGGSVQPSSMVLLVQKEVAKRIVAKDKKESVLSISVKAYGHPRYVETVKAELFSPPPAVDSAVLVIDAISRVFFDGVNEDDFFTLVKTGFSSKRKFVASNLKKLVSDIDTLFIRAGVDPHMRAEDLSLDAWKSLSVHV